MESARNERNLDKCYVLNDSVSSLSVCSVWLGVCAFENFDPGAAGGSGGEHEILVFKV